MVTTNASGEAMYRNPPPGKISESPAARHAVLAASTVSSTPTSSTAATTTTSRSTSRRLTGPIRAGRSGSSSTPLPPNRRSPRGIAVAVMCCPPHPAPATPAPPGRDHTTEYVAPPTVPSAWPEAGCPARTSVDTVSSAWV